MEIDLNNCLLVVDTYFSRVLRIGLPAKGINPKYFLNHIHDSKQAYTLAQNLSKIFGKHSSKAIAYKKLALWYQAIQVAEFNSFNTIANIIKNNYQHILNYFNNRSNNASAESFNAKKAMKR